MYLGRQLIVNGLLQPRREPGGELFDLRRHQRAEHRRRRARVSLLGLGHEVGGDLVHVQEFVHRLTIVALRRIDQQRERIARL